MVGSSSPRSSETQANGLRSILRDQGGLPEAGRRVDQDQPGFGVI
jgi:hypothetical protein